MRAIRAVAGFLLATLLVIAAAVSALAADGAITVVSTATSGEKGNGASYGPPRISADGTKIVFTSRATNLDPSDTDDIDDVFIKDLLTGATTLVSTAADGTKGNGSSGSPSLSADGSIVVFWSSATNLHPSDTESHGDIYVKNLVTGAVTIASTSAAGVLGNNGSSQPSISDDGTTVAFLSFATNLEPIDNPSGGIYVKDLASGAITLASTTSDGTRANNPVDNPTLSADGTAVAFASGATNLAPEDGDTVSDIYVKDLVTSAITLVSISSDGEKGDGHSYTPSISADGSVVAFESEATNLQAADVDTVRDVLVKDLADNTFALASRASASVKGNGQSWGASLSGDGRTVMFQSEATNLDARDTDRTADLYVMRLAQGSLTLASITDDGVKGNGTSHAPASLSPAGDRAAFVSEASNLSASDPDSNWDVFLKELTGAPSPPPVSGSFVQRDGEQLTLNGFPYSFRGLNVYNANSHGWCWFPMMSGSALGDALDSMGERKNVMRSWFFQSLAQPTPDSPTQYRTWDAFDHTLAVAGAHGVKVIVTLTDQWGECGDGGLNGYKGLDWYQSGYLEPDPGMLVSYRDWVAEVVTRYRDDPRIAFWQLINEAEAANAVDGQQGDCPAGNEAADALKNWASDVAGLVKSIDPNHLVSLGSIGGGQCGMSSDQYAFVHDIPEIDLCEYHDYTPTQPMPGDEWNGLQVRLDQCAALDKPLFVGEVGIVPNQVGGTLEDRAAALLAKLEVQSAAGVQGVLAWAWNSGATGDTASFDIGPDDPLLDVLMVNNALQAVADEPAPVRAGTSAQIDVLANDRDDDGDEIVIRSWTQPAHGAVTCSPDICTYVADAGHDGTDSFTYRIADGKGALADGTVALSVWATVAPSLVGEQLTYEYADSEGEVIEGTVLPITSITCDRDGTSTLTFDASGTAYGPYPGTFQQSGTIVIGPQTNPPAGQPTLNSGALITLDTSFTITSGDIEISGQMEIAAQPEYAFGTCGSFNPGDNPFIPTLYGSLVDARARTTFSATITTPIGDFIESGEAHTVLYENDNFDTEGSRTFHWRDAQFFQAFLFSTSADTTPPTVTINSPTDGAVYSTGDVVTADYTCEDEPGGSGIAACTGFVPSGTELDLSIPGSYSFTVTATDGAGNTTELTHTYEVEVPEDAVPPVIALTTPADGAVFQVGDVVIVEFECTDEDGGSGIVECSGDVADGDALFLVPGTYSFVVYAEDAAGNSSQVMHIYDVIAAQDADEDGLLDTWETDGIDADGDGTIDLALHQAPFNADPNRKDVFIEIDYLTCAAGGCAPGDTHSHEPEFAGLDDAVIAFADSPVDNPDGSTGITLHLMVGDAMPDSLEIAFTTRRPGPADDYDDYKLGSAPDPCDGYFGTAAERSSMGCDATLQARRLAFHYAIYGHSYSEAPLSSGIAEIRGNDFMVTLGGDPGAWIDASGTMREAEAGTLMHELGHNLGLHHGGADAVNCKPNYLSVMNYTLQVPYMDPTRPLDYSRSETLTLDESLLTETDGIGTDDDLEGRYVIHGVDGADTYSEITGTGEIDWNGNGDVEAFLTEADVNWLDVIGDCGESAGDVLEGHDDWSNLVYNFRAFPDYAHGSRQTSVTLVAEELPSDVALEVAQTVDFDGDGTPNAEDSCPAASDPGQGDLDGDGTNDACDAENLVRIDILPGNAKNQVPKGLSQIKVAVLSSPTFSAHTAVNRTSLTFGKTGTEHSLAKCTKGGSDVNKDRLRDLVCVFTRAQTGLVPGDLIGVLHGRTMAGLPFVGRDAIVILKTKK